MAFFTEREGDLPSQTNDALPPQFIEAIATELVGLADRWWLARGWPLRCPDDQSVVVGTDLNKFWQATRAKLNLSAQGPGELVNEPNALAVLNVIEYVRQHIARPTIIGDHKYYGHNHLGFYGQAGKEEFQAEINDLFKRYGLAYQLTDDGVVIRLAPEEIRENLVDAVFQTGDKDLDGLLNAARTKFLDPNPATRKEGLEKLWDAFERLKTITLGKDKKAQIAALIESAYAEPDARTRLDVEFSELGRIGNAYNIRHFETNKLPIPDFTFVDWLFSRCYSAIHAILEKTARVKH